MIKIENLSFRYSKKQYAINNISLRIRKGEFVTILGHNGSGKSTLAKLIIGLLEKESGSIVVDGLTLNEENIYKIRQKVGIVFQNPDNQFVGVTVKDDIAFGLENRNMDYDEMIKLINEYSKLVRMDEFLNKNPENLSGGQKQRVAIAGVLAMNPDIIIFDEATSMLDPEGVQEVMDVIKELKGKKTIISITHNLQESLFSDKVIVMKKGEIVLEGKSEDVFKHEEILEDSSLSILESMKLKNMIKGLKNKQLQKQLEEILWEYTFRK